MSLVRFKTHRPGFSNTFNRFFNDDLFFHPVKQVFNQNPAVNVRELENAFAIDVAVPGLKKEDFKIELEDGRLSISAELKNETEDKNDRYTRKEFSYQSFRRVFNIPETVDAEGIDANYENGILSINLPKKEEAVADKKKTIAIQ